MLSQHQSCCGTADSLYASWRISAYILLCSCKHIDSAGNSELCCTLSQRYKPKSSSACVDIASSGLITVLYTRHSATAVTLWRSGWDGKDESGSSTLITCSQVSIICCPEASSIDVVEVEVRDVGGVDAPYMIQRGLA